MFVVESHPKACPYMPWRGLHHTAIWIDRGGHPRIGRPQHPAMVLDGAHPHHIQVLPRGAGISVPAIVGDIHQHLCAHLRKLANLVPEDGLVADKGAVSVPSTRKDNALLTRVEQSDVLQQISRKEEELLIRHIFPERHQMHLVVPGEQLPVRINKISRVVHVPPATHMGVRAHRNISHDERRIRSPRQSR